MLAEVRDETQQSCGRRAGVHGRPAARLGSGADQDPDQAVPVASVAQAAPAFPPLTGRVTDAAGVLPADVAASLDAKLAALETATGTQLEACIPLPKMVTSLPAPDIDARAA